MAGTRTLTGAALVRELVRIGAVELRTDPEKWFTWTSGRRAPVYCDNRLLCGQAEVRGQVADALAASIQGAFGTVEVIAGTATAGIPHAAWVAERLALPMVYVRGEAKGHGRARRVEGRELRGERVVVVEDLMSTGGSALSSIEGLRAEGAEVVGVQAIFTYDFPEAGAALDASGVPWRALAGYTELVESLDLEPGERDTLLAWREG